MLDVTTAYAGLLVHGWEVSKPGNCRTKKELMLGVGFQPLEAYVLKTQFLAAVMREPKVNSSLNLKKDTSVTIQQKKFPRN